MKFPGGQTSIKEQTVDLGKFTVLFANTLSSEPIGAYSAKHMNTYALRPK